MAGNLFLCLASLEVSLFSSAEDWDFIVCREPVKRIRTLLLVSRIIYKCECAATWLCVDERNSLCVALSVVVPSVSCPPLGLCSSVQEGCPRWKFRGESSSRFYFCSMSILISGEFNEKCQGIQAGHFALYHYVLVLVLFGRDFNIEWAKILLTLTDRITFDW